MKKNQSENTSNAKQKQCKSGKPCINRSLQWKLSKPAGGALMEQRNGETHRQTEDNWLESSSEKQAIELYWSQTEKHHVRTILFVPQSSFGTDFVDETCDWVIYFPVAVFAILVSSIVFGPYWLPYLSLLVFILCVLRFHTYSEFVQFALIEKRLVNDWLLLKSTACVWLVDPLHVGPAPSCSTDPYN